jgi:hypothetical protein
MSRFMSLVVIGIMCAVLGFGCATQAARSTVLPASKAEALEAEIQKAKTIEASPELAQDQVEAWLRVASMALDAGRPEVARQTLIDTTGFMAANEPEKDFAKRAKKSLRMLGGEERQKYFLGDPYEQLFAYLYLGMLDFQAGDYQNAKASFRSASLADEGSKDEGYKSDCYLAFLLEGIAARVNGDPGQGEAAFALAEKAYRFRQLMPVMEQAFASGGARCRPSDERQDEVDRFTAMFELAFSQLPISLAIAPGPAQCVNEVFEGANRTLGAINQPRNEKEEKIFQDRPEGMVLKTYGKDKLADVPRDLNRLRQATESDLPAINMEPIDAACRQFAEVVRKCRDPKTNVFILQQAGMGPAKVREGLFGEVIRIRPTPESAARMAALIQPAGSTAAPLITVALPGESVDYQAMTRGGRYVDSLLGGKARFKAAMNITSDVAGAVALASLATAGTLAATDSSKDATIAALVVAGVAFATREASLAVSDSTHPEGDIRGWHELPSRLFFACASLDPGEYDLEARFFDLTAQALPNETKKARLKVEAGPANLFLLGSPWQN